MGRREKPLTTQHGALADLAADLRDLRRVAGCPSYRELAARAHYSRSALAQAASGKTLPTWPVLVAYVAACGADPDPWRARWQQVRTALDGPDHLAEPAWPAEPVADGADPDAAGCGGDAITVHDRKVALTGTRAIVGHLQLRYSPSTRAAWARFEGYSSLDHLSHKHLIEIEMQAVRGSDNGAAPTATAPFRVEYLADFHWSDLLCTGQQPVTAHVNIYLDGQLAASAHTKPLLDVTSTG